MKTRFFFVVDKAPVALSDGTSIPSEVTAVFADSAGTECYTHVGQHGACNPDWIRESTVPATPRQYALLLTELAEIGYDVEVIAVPDKYRPGKSACASCRH